jgi:hypothetical protein
MLRKAAQLPVQKLWQTTGELLSTFTPSASTYFAGVGLIAAAILLNGYLQGRTYFEPSAAGTDGQTVMGT